jgi:cation diffusion facilitator family transporter
MHSHSLENWQHPHSFLGRKHERHERRTWLVVGLASVMMVVEIVGGTVFGSMAVVADGWHMATHVAALAIAGLAYLFARRHAQNPRFAFGTGKLGDLAGFTSAIILGMVALFIGYECVSRLYAPVPIRFDEAMLVATLGLAVNLASAWLLGDDHHHDHDHEDEDEDEEAGHHHHDHNLRSAYVHVLADALTSVLAIAGLLLARLYGWLWIDAAVGLFGAAVIAAWSVALVRASGAVLLDAVPSDALAERVRERLEQDSDRVADLHLWRVGPGHAALIVALVSDQPQAPSVYKERLRDIDGLSHVTVEVHACPDHPRHAA